VLSTCIYKSPFGEIGLLKERDNLLSISFLDIAFKHLEVVNKPKEFKEVVEQLNEYFYEGRKRFEIQYRLISSTFRSSVYEEMLKISYGSTISYSDLAIKVGKPKAFRAVGTACGKNPLPLIIPCHRVKGKSSLGGFTGGLDIKKFLLRLESI
jgi:methylated-DNA-[protein]-cysteine S-methyltransferase